MRGKDMFTDMAIEELRGQIEHFSAGWEIVSSIRHVVACSSASRSLPTRRFVPSSSPIPT